MKHAIWLAALAGALGMTAFSVAGEGAKCAVKAGDAIYACGCGDKCPCDTMARKGGKCTCAKEIKPMVKAEVREVANGKASLAVNGKERSFVAVAKYRCGCGPACSCKAVSQAAGKCPCGREMKKAK